MVLAFLSLSVKFADESQCEEQVSAREPKTTSNKAHANMLPSTRKHVTKHCDNNWQRKQLPRKQKGHTSEIIISKHVEFVYQAWKTCYQATENVVPIKGNVITVDSNTSHQTSENLYQAARNILPITRKHVRQHPQTLYQASSTCES